MKMQSIVDIGVAAMRKQGVRSMATVHVPVGRYVDRGPTEEDVCRFRGDDGAKCFVGTFIDDSIYEDIMETKSVLALSQDYPELAWMNLKLNGGPLDLLYGLQRWHDDDPFYDGKVSVRGEHHLMDLCARFNLDYPATDRPGVTTVVNPVKDREALAAQHREREAYADRHKW